MMNKLATVICYLCFFTACNEPAKQNNTNTDSNFTSSTTGTITGKIEKKSIADSSLQTDTIQAKDSVTQINVTRNPVLIKGYIKPNQHPSFTFRVKDKDSVIAIVKPSEKTGNIRISQVEMPDKSFDGPFGNELRYKTKGNGIYRIILSQNMMAGDPYNGGYYLSVEVK